MVRAPEGFVRVQAAPDAPYFVLEEGNTIQGKLLGLYERDDKRSVTGKTKFFQVEISEPCTVRTGRGEDVEIGEAEVGEIVNLNYTPMTKSLEDYARKTLRGGEYDVFATITGGKKKLANGNTMWPIDVFVKVVKEPVDEQPDFEGPAAAAGE